jgi:hypothetical protein
MIQPFRFSDVRLPDHTAYLLQNEICNNVSNYNGSDFPDELVDISQDVESS